MLTVQKCASTGNRTRVYRVAGDNSTTEPSMLDKLQQLLVPSIHAIYFKLVFQVALCLLKVQFIELSCFCWLFKKFASTGNRTLVYRVAGDKSTTEPSMLDKLQQLLVPFRHAIVFTLVFQVALCVSWMFKLTSSHVFVDCSKMCIDRESNPGLSRGRRQFYHWTIDAWQIATITGSFHTCNLFHVGFSSCSVFVESSIYRALPFLLIVQKMCIDRESNPGLSRGRRQFYHWTIDACQIATITGSFHTCNLFQVVFQVALCLLKVQFIELSCFCWLFKKCASTGNRTLVYRVTGDKSTTEPSMLDKLQQILVLLIHAIVFTLVFQVALCVSWMFKLSSSPVFVDCSKMCIDRESNPGLSRGRRQFYHWTIDAWQIATITGSFHICNLFHVGFPSCSVFVESSIYRALPFLFIVQKMCIDRESNPGLSRGRRQFYHWTIDAWQIATITGSFHTCNLFHVGFPGCSVFVESSIYRALLFLLIVQKMCIDRQSGNRTLVYRVAGDTSTTEPSMLDKLQHLLVLLIHAIVFTLVYQVALCVSWMFKLSSSPVFVDCSKMCIVRESNPGLSRGRRQFYHWTIDAWQIATSTGSFHTCNLFHVGFPSCSVFVEISIYRALPFLFLVQKMCIDRESNPGLSRGRRQFYHWTIDAWQIATITGSFHTCNRFHVGFPGCSVFVESSIYRALLFLLIVQKMCIDRQSGNRTLVYRVAGDTSTTEPSMLDKLQQLLVPFIHAIVLTLVFQVALCVSWMFKLSSSPVFVDCSKMCIVRESNPGLSHGRRQFYHWTIDAWQIATITGSFHTCNLFHVGFPSCSVFVEDSISRALPILLIVQKMCIDRQ